MTFRHEHGTHLRRKNYVEDRERVWGCRVLGRKTFAHSGLDEVRAAEVWRRVRLLVRRVVFAVVERVVRLGLVVVVPLGVVDGVELGVRGGPVDGLLVALRALLSVRLALAARLTLAYVSVWTSTWIVPACLSLAWRVSPWVSVWKYTK